MKRIIPTILAVLAVINMIWLFVFDYRIPSLPGRGSKEAAEPSYTEEEIQAAAGEDMTEQTAAENGEEPAAGEAVQEEKQETEEGAQTEETEEGAQTEEAEEGAQTEEAEEGDQTEEAERTCRPAEGNAPNIRSGPGSDNEVIGSVGEGEVMTVRGEEEDGWLPIRTADGLEGYVFADLVVMDEAEE